jgi:hypothetical protein
MPFLNSPSSIQLALRISVKHELQSEKIELFNTPYNTSSLTGDKTNMGCSFQLTSGLST